jgi:DNA-binding response OmpR family regulator
MTMARTVLIVEDETKIRELLRSYLERDGLDVLTTASGAEAITLAGRAAPDLIVLDLGLPDGPGEVVAREIKQSSRVPILVLTASAEEDRILGLEAEEPAIVATVIGAGYRLALAGDG